MTAVRAANTATAVAHDVEWFSEPTGAAEGVAAFALPHAPLSMPRQQLETGAEQPSRTLFGALFLGVRQLAVATQRSGG